MKTIFLLIAALVLSLSQTNAKTLGCLYANELYANELYATTTHGSYGSNTNYGTKIKSAANKIYTSSNSSSKPCVICRYGVNPTGKCKSGPAPIAYNGDASNYFTASIPPDTSILVAICIVCGAACHFIRRTL